MNRNQIFGHRIMVKQKLKKKHRQKPVLKKQL